MVTFKSAHGEEHEHIYGAVDKDGKMWGEGFTVQKDQAGCYTIKFEPNQFGAKPGVVASVYVDSITSVTNNLSVLVSEVSESSFKCYTLDTTGCLDYAPFTFIAFGEKK
ncbi:MAG: hypothetical protein F6J94_06975 [Moorea sp. SIO1F2]|uniref:hypothetical protein n=1 Tax=Moorena sp. SIO1F2 TaxID=2607819 RepID=UPI0013B627CC|nr:hypothetical protein [Moorena sp. SIO1F2]NET81706.1 hypothetical protein [Moorena sp. SIO1F2]